jgi:hypothetical protein
MHEFAPRLAPSLKPIVTANGEAGGAQIDLVHSPSDTQVTA